MGFKDSSHTVTVLNVNKMKCELPGFKGLVGDARAMPQFKPHEFDVVFSNSVIEHVGTIEDQRSMAEEVRRVGKFYFVQTPNFFFPIEPHFLFPFFHWLPLTMRAWLLSRFDLGWYKKAGSLDEAISTVRQIRLLTYRELKHLFPEAMIVRERFLGLTKSFMVIKNVDYASGSV